MHIGGKMMQDDNPTPINIPRNYKVQGKWKGMYLRNLFEAAVVDVAVAFIILGTPLIWQLKVILIVVFVALFSVLLVHGINGKSTLQFLVTYIKFVYKKKIYHFQNLEEVYGQTGQNRKESSGRSNLEKLLEDRKSKKQKV